MSYRTEAPYQPQDRQVIRELIQTLDAHCKKNYKRGKGSFSVRKNTYTLPSGRTVDSWKMQEWDYKKPDLPTYARGLFTIKNSQGDWEIAVRGYDKFFNHGEVSKTRWENVEKNTMGPYELSVKENGCIIFIAGLDDDTLLVCSKHSTGKRDDVEKSHSQAGEEWVERHLKSVGKTKVDLARKLREMNATAVAELCDDAFEEHVLAYTPESAGLYLHGINLNLPEFATYPGHLIDKFAEEWGFRKTMYRVMDDVKEVKQFLDKTAETGAYAGRDTEGFVIRCRARDSEGAPWHDWFFKYKFEEPYLMYRQWRECTKAIIAGKPPHYKKHKKITEEYLNFARRQFINNKHLMKEYNQNHGIIALRDAFLKERGLDGAEIIRREIEAGEEGPENAAVQRNVILVPVATIGCGKTTVAYALAKLFNWGHQQNDNIVGKGNRAQRFTTAICNLLVQHPVVIADRNNHQKREREQLLNDISKAIPDAKFVALHYVHDRENYDTIRKTLQDRVLSRGDNHQTIQATTKGSQEVIGIMEGFLNRFQPVDTNEPPDNGFDLVIDLDVTASSRQNLETVISRLSSEYPKLFGEMPTADELDDATTAALNEYKPDLKHEIGGKPRDKKQKGGTQQQEQNGGSTKAKTPKLEFFAVRLPSARVASVLETVFRDADPETARFYRQLYGSRRLQTEFHVTLMHRASASQHPDKWDKLVEIHKEKFDPNSPQTEPELGTCQVKLERIVWDGRVMCFVVRLLNGGEGSWETVNPIAHVTVGTANKDIKPKESNDLLQRWVKEGSGESGIRDLLVNGNVVLDGSVRGVLQKF